MERFPARFMQYTVQYNWSNEAGRIAYVLKKVNHITKKPDTGNFGKIVEYLLMI